MMNIPFPFLNLEFLYYQIYKLFSGELDLTTFYDYMVNFSASFMPYATILSLIILSGIVYCYLRYTKIEHDIEHAHGHSHGLNFTLAEEEKKVNGRWTKIVEHLNSDNESDWRLAILEADLILEEMLEKMGYVGDSVGDRLRGVERSDFHTLDSAWEGHRIRNMVVHEGINFQINNREARRAVHLYEQVFKEFHFI